MALLVTSYAPSGRAVEADLAGGKSPYQINVWTTEDGLPQNAISCLKQTHDGYLWIGTRFGLARFDGVHFVRFDESTTPEMVNESVDALAEDTDGTLWIGTAGGLLSHRNQRFERVHIPIQEKQSVRRLCASSRGGVWLCTSDSRIFLLHNGQFSAAWAPSRTNEDVISMCESANGWLNVFTRGKWLTVSPTTMETRTNAVRPPGPLQWNAALPARDSNHAWIGTRQGMFELSKESWRPVAESALATNSVELIFQDRLGNIWAGSRNDKFGKWDGSLWQPIDFGDAVEKSSGISMEEDSEGTLWIATEGGLVQLRESSAVVYTKSDGLAHNKVWSVCQGTDGEIWVGTEHGLSRIERSGNIETMSLSGKEANPADRCVWPRQGGGVWTAKNNIGLYVCIGDDLKPAAPADVLQKSPITCLAESRDGLLYVCTEKAVFGFRQDAPLPWTKEALRIDLGKVRSLCESSDGTIWMGTDGNGVARLTKGDTALFSQKNGLIGNHVWSITEDRNGTLWFGTDKGLGRYLKGNFCSFTHEQGLLEDRVNCILADDEGHLWLSGLSGIYRIQIADLNAVAERKKSHVQPFAVGTAEGLKRAETNGEKQPAGWKADDGRLWFPTMRGVVAIDPKKFPMNEKPPHVIIEQISADGTILEQEETNSANATFSNGEQPTFYHPIAAGHGHVLEFQYTATSLVDAKRAKFRYRLINADSEWREETSERSVRYVNLKPGKYRFQVKAANHRNVWTTEPAEFAFSLAPYFWQTKAFYGVSGAAVLAIAAGLQAYRLRWQHRLLKLEQQRALAAERARIARDLHDDLGTALTGLALELDVIGRDPKPESPVVHRLGQTAQRTRALAERMREVVWSVNPLCDTVSSLASFLEQQISQFLRAGDIKVELDFPEDIPALPIGGDARHQLALGVREALTNVVRHAQATNVILSLAIDQDWLVVRVKDNGRGLAPSNRNGDGFRNMRDRLQSIGGTFDSGSEPGSGTTITFKVPLIKLRTGESI